MWLIKFDPQERHRSSDLSRQTFPHLIIYVDLDIQPMDEGQAKAGEDGKCDGGKKQPVTEPTLQLHEIRLDDRLLAALIKPDEASDQEAIQLRKWVDEWLHTKVRIQDQEVAP